MSHVAKLDCQISNLEDLEAACKELGLVLVKGKTTYRWWGYSVGDYPIPSGYTAEELGKCQHCITIPGDNSCFEIGVVPSKTGDGYDLLWDFYGHAGQKMMNHVGKDGFKLKDEYLAQTTIRHMRRRGRQVTREVNARGEIVLRGR